LKGRKKARKISKEKIRKEGKKTDKEGRNEDKEGR
jgi:hypothetical protein